MASRHVLKYRNLLSLGIAYVIAVFQSQPKSAPVDTGFKHAAARPEFNALPMRTGDYDPEQLREKMRESVPLRTCPNCALVMLRRMTECPECHVTLPRLRDRVRSKPLTAADIVAGGVYVPKRGNNKTAPIIVRAAESNCDGVVWVDWSQRGVGQFVHPVGDFLAMVARRVTP